MFWRSFISRKVQELPAKEVISVQKEESDQHFLSVGTEVSAKYRGAFCEAKIKSVKKSVIFRVTNKKDGKSYNIPEESVKGPLKIGSAVEAQFPEQNSWTEAVIQSARDKSVYTVEFDDGDVRTLHRSSLCLQGVRHFAESETLDHLPLTDPENFGTPVLTKRKPKRKTPQSTSTNGDEDNDSDDQKSSEREPSAKRKLVTTTRHISKDEDQVEESEEEKRKKWLADPLMGKLVLVEPPDKRKHWYPAVCVNPLSYEDFEDLSSSQIVVRSFKNGKLQAVERCQRLTKQNAPSKVEPSWKDVMECAFMWEETRMVPDSWRTDIKDILDEEDEENAKNNEKASTSAEDLEKNHDFLEQLYKFMEDRGSPVNKTPVLGYKDLDLFLLYRLVQAKGGFHAIVNAPDWREIYCELGIPKVSQAAGHHAKMAYTKYLLSFEEYLMSFKQSTPKDNHKRGKKSETLKGREKRASRGLSGRASPLTRSDDDQEHSSKRRSRRRKMSESVTDEQDVTTPLKETKRGRRSKVDDSKRDSDLDDASSTASSEKSTTRSRLSSANDSAAQKFGARGGSDRRRSNSGTKRKNALYKAGDKIRVKYGKDSFKLYIAKVVDVDFDDGPDVQYYVHYTGWNSRHDEWIKSWQISGCLNENDPVTPNSSPAPGKVPGRRPKTPTPGESSEKKHTPSPPTNIMPCVSLTRGLEGVSQALNFNTPPKSAAVKEEPAAHAAKQEPKPEVSAKKPGKGRTRRQSMSSSSSAQPEVNPTVKRAASEEKTTPDVKVKQEVVAEKEDSPKPVLREKHPSGRITPPSALTAAARRMSSRRSKSPAYLKEFGITKRKRTTSTTSTTETPASDTKDPVNPSTAETAASSPDQLASEPLSSNATESTSSKENETKSSEHQDLTDEKESSAQKEQEVAVTRDEEKLVTSSQAAYDNFDEEAPIIALEKPKPQAPPVAVDSRNIECLSRVALDALTETDLSDSAAAAENNIQATEAEKSPPPIDLELKPTSPKPDEHENEDDSTSTITEKQPSQCEDLPTTDSNTSDESSFSENNERPSDDSQERVDDPPPYIHPPVVAPQPQQLVPPPLPQGAPSSSKVLVENTPPTTPEASPEHFYDDQDMNGESDNAGMAGSGASSLSGDVPASSSSPDYPPKEETCPDDKDGGGSGGDSAPKRKYRKGQSHRRSSSKTDARNKSRKSAPGDTDSDDDAPSSGKGNDGTPSKGRRRMSKRRAKSKPEPPSAPPPVVGEELAKMNPDERIRVLQSKLAEMRKVYQQLKQEVSSIDRKRKRAKRREQEAAEVTSPLMSKKHCSSPDKRDHDDIGADKGDIEADIAASNAAGSIV